MAQHKVIPKEFFNRPVLEICPDLLGHFLCVKIENKTVRAEICELEAYDGPEDKACHASKGKTARTEVMFGEAGNFYIYLCYGVHWLLNIVTGPVDSPAAILIRGVSQWTGPGKLTKALHIDKRFAGKAATPKTGLWFEENPDRDENYPYETTPRVGVDYAGDWANKPYRFIRKQ